jgi:hypothetical protein
LTAEGNHQIYVESPLYGGCHVFIGYYYDGIENYNNPMTLRGYLGQNRRSPATTPKTATAKTKNPSFSFSKIR